MSHLFSDAQKDIIVRMSGCPNGCSRPWLGEIGFVGRSMEDDGQGVMHGIYDMYFGGNASGSRLNNKYKTGLSEAQILSELRPILSKYLLAKEASRSELRFGDFAIQEGLVRECNARPGLKPGQRQPAISFHINVTDKEKMVEEVAQLADGNVDGLRDLLQDKFRISDVRSLEW